MSMPYVGNCEHLKQGYCINCISKILGSKQAEIEDLKKQIKHQ